MLVITDKPATVVRTERGLSIAGTRITLYAIMDYMLAGYPDEYIRELYRLSPQQIADVRTYINEHREEVEAEYQQVLRDAEEARRYWEVRNRERLARLAARPPRPEVVALLAKLAARRAQRHES